LKNIDRSALHIRASNNSKSTGIAEFAHNFLPCILGRGGITARKSEGDSATPAGCFKILYGFYRPDRIRHLSSEMELHPIKPDYGWCDDPSSRDYNRFIRLPFAGSHEKLWRDDNLYDICLILDYNIYPRKRNAGSAIFFHLKHEDNRPTLGCIAISLGRMKKFLAQCSGQSEVVFYL
jgi:L,D-peptidoglycan transpeptidase YkuD (ErfK/YbiS/YcfS/YnhG family)